jgi:hypothetical protein
MTEAKDIYQYDIFIGYSHHDKDRVLGWLLAQLEAAGLRVCIDFRDFEPGLPSLVNMENAVERSRKTLIVLTPAWVESEWTTFESLLIQTDDPAGRRARMIPLLLKPCKPPKRIAMLTYLDFTQPSEVEFQLQRLVSAIRGEPSLKTNVCLPDLREFFANLQAEKPLSDQFSCILDTLVKIIEMTLHLFVASTVRSYERAIVDEPTEYLKKVMPIKRIISERFTNPSLATLSRLASRCHPSRHRGKSRHLNR